VLMAGMDLPLKAIREQVASAVGMIVHVGRLSDGSRRVLEISEVTGMETDVIQLSDLYRFNWDAGVDRDGKFQGTIEPTGLRPSFDKHLQDLGIDLPSDIFGDPASLIGGSKLR
ncbi:MAG: CpaF family protein, partial [Acidimicrobiales bacterium]